MTNSYKAVRYCTKFIVNVILAKKVIFVHLCDVINNSFTYKAGTLR